MSQSRVFGLDLVRAAAIGLVLASHLLGVLEPLGVLGVELFFVLSGFLVGGIFLRVRIREARLAWNALLQFWRRRWWRTLPNYFLFLLVFVVISAFRNDFPGWQKICLYPFFLQNWLWQPDSFFLISWSLAVEEWFYLLMPLCVLFVGTFVRSPSTSFLIGCVAMGALSCLARVEFFNEPAWDQTARKVCLVRMDALMCGCLVAFAQQQMVNWYKRFASVPFGCLALVGAIICSLEVFRAFPNRAGLVTPVWLLALVPVAFSLLLPAAAAWRESHGTLALCITNTSKWSYSLYLVHIPIILLVSELLGSGGGWAVKIFGKLLSLTLSFVCAAVIYRLYEQPMMSLRLDQELAPPRAPGIV